MFTQPPRFGLCLRLGLFLGALFVLSIVLSTGCASVKTGYDEDSDPVLPATAINLPTLAPKFPTVTITLTAEGVDATEEPVTVADYKTTIPWLLLGTTCWVHGAPHVDSEEVLLKGVWVHKPTGGNNFDHIQVTSEVIKGAALQVDTAYNCETRMVFQGLKLPQRPRTFTLITAP